MNRGFNVQKAFLLFIIIFIVINLLFLTFWFKYGVQTSIKQGYEELQNELHNDIIDNIEKNIKDNKKLDTPSLFEHIANKYNLLLIVRNSKYEVIYTNIENISDREYLTPFVVNIDDEDYLISVGKTNTINTISITKKFMIFEIIFISTITLLGLIIANKLLLEPINVTVRDINNYKFGIKPSKRKVTNEIYYVQNEFVDLTKSLEKEHEEQNRIISAISHDIKTPLTSVIGYSDLLINSKLTKKEMKELQEKIYNKAIHMKDIVSDFDDYLLSHKNRTYIFKSVNVRDLLNNIRFEYFDDLKEKNIRFDVINRARKANINIDIGKINRVFNNLIVNSIRHIKEEKGHIVIECRDDKEYFYFKCIDNGIGVDEKNIKKIFDPLFTTDKSRKISGLGLSITKEIVEMHGGTVKASNNKEKGLTIEFSISKNMDIEE
ncbi:MAG: HAMP domain-containing histidine kinase [Bacilli bacterium]|nr:HAMP domain-containing histidine kinase [Bacilli bacterium]